MKVIVALGDLRTALRDLPRPLGLVPTMGFLHEGHLSLVRLAKRACRSVGVSIFVNPAQFGPREDLASYPSDVPRDLALLEAEGVDIVWTPTADEVYPEGFQTWVTVGRVAERLEGEHRPGHFRGVATVVTKLFHAFEPQRAYFGQKDAQQVAVVRRMTRDLAFPIEIVVGPTVREPDGLALSSRNVYLTQEQRRAAPILFRALSASAQDFDAGGREADVLRRRMEAVLAEEPLAQPQYVSVADPDSLEELTGPIQRGLLSMAVRIGATRLIDNVVVESRSKGQEVAGRSGTP